MFTVCPKCALTLVVTAQDLRVAQGYVRCGRCSNVFNAIVGLTDDRGALGNPGSQGTATTSIIRKAPSISDDGLPGDPLSETGESEAIYAEPDADEVKFQEVFTEPVTPTRAPAPPPAAPSPKPTTRTPGGVSFAAPPPGPAVKAPAPAPTTPSQKMLDVEKRYSDTEGIDTYPESELEFNPAVTDVTKVFVEAAPVAFKGDATTGKFRKIVGGEHDEDAAPSGTAKPQASKAAGATPASTAKPATSTAPAPAPTAARDPEDLEIDSELRSLAARLDATASRPAPKFPAAAANDEGGKNAAADAGGGIGDIYAKAVPRPREPSKPATATQRAEVGVEAREDLGADAEPQSADSAIETFTPTSAPRSRFMWWVAGAAVLSLALVAQAIHHNRHSLATNALLNRPLTRFYNAIGVPLVPAWDLRSYDVRQLGASTSESGEGTLTVRASLKNNAAQPLPLPLLRITMQDRYGNRIATRDVSPSGYVPGALPSEAHLGAGQRIDAEMTFKDPGQNAVGFEIDACLATAAGRVACANDAAPALR